MIAYKYSYSHAHEDDDSILVEINVDKDLVKLMLEAVCDEIKDTAIFLKVDANDADEVDDGINHIKDMISSYRNLKEALEDIEIAEGLSQIPDDDDNE